MKLTKKIRYALVALEELESSHKKGYPKRIADIAQKKNLPISFLQQLLLQLKRHGLVESVRGPRGGYFLTRKASHIYLGDIIRALEGPIRLVDCSFFCQKRLSCITKKLGEKLTTHITNFLDNITLEELCQ